MARSRGEPSKIAVRVEKHGHFSTLRHTHIFSPRLGGQFTYFHVHKSTPAEKSKSRQVKNPLCQSHRQAHSLVKRSIGPTLPNLITKRITDTNRMLECTPPHSGYERNSDAVRQPSSPDRCSLRGHPNFSRSRIAFVRFAVRERISFVAPVALALRMIQP